MKINEKKLVFLSHSSKTKYDAYTLKGVLEEARFNVISDFDHKGSFWEFMEQIEQCDMVVVILNNSFFSSAYCVYELFKAYKCDIQIYVFSLYELNAVKREEDRLKSYRRMVDRLNESVMSPKQRNEFAFIYENFENYNELVLKVLNEYTFRGRHNDFSNVIAEFLKEVDNAEISPFEIRQKQFLDNRELYGIDIIDEEERSEFVFFLHDLVRCSYFSMSLFDEDCEGEIEWKYVAHEIKKCEFGYLMIISVVDLEGNRHDISIDRIKTIEQNTASCSDDFLKYYIHVYNPNKIRAYFAEMRKPEDKRERRVISDFLTDGIDKRRITLAYEDHDAFE